MRASTKRVTSLLIAFLLIVMTIAVYSLFLAPALDEIGGLRGRIAAQSSLLSAQKDAVQKFQQLKTLYSDQYQNLDNNLANTLPTKEEVPGVVNQIQALSRVSNLALQTLTFKYASLKPAAKASALVKPIGTLSVTLQTAGSYEGLKSFLKGIETNIRVMDVVSVKSDPIRRGEEVAQNLFLHTIEVETYYQ